MRERFPMPIPFGWFFIGYSDELKAGDLKSVHYFGEDLVLFRTESGAAGVMEAYCPHLGAHLGHGGKVDGEAVRCPFHAWAFNTEGACVDVPYAKVIPPAARRPGCIRSYPVCEKNGVVWVWYHPDNIAPTFEVIEREETISPEWSAQQRFFWAFGSNPQEIAENGVDVAHFRYVHKMDAVPEGETTYADHVRRSVVRGERTVTMPDGQTRVVNSEIEVIQNGAGQKFTRFKGIADLMLQVLVTPVERDSCELRFSFTHPKFEPGSFEDKVIQQAIAGTIGQTGVEGDIPIWHNKIHRARPILCDGDGPVLMFRKYFSQFYPDSREPTRVAAE